MNSDIVTHYLEGGADLDITRDNIRRLAAEQAQVPIPARPLFNSSEDHIRFELEMRHGPSWRCSHCGWFYPDNKYRPIAPPCHACSAAGRPVSSMQRYTGGPITWPPTIDGPERTWCLAVASRHGIPLAPTAKS